MGTLGRVLLILLCGAGLFVLVLANDWTTPAPWIREAQASGFNKERAQVVLFQGEIRSGARIDRADPYLPPLDNEASHGRAENYDRCKVALDTYHQTGQVRHVGFDDPHTLFTVAIDGARWNAEHDETVLEDVACFFQAGDVRRTLVFPIYDEKGRRLGEWRHGRIVEEGLSARNGR